MKHEKKPKVSRYQKVFKEAVKHAKGKSNFRAVVSHYIKTHYKKV